MYTQTFYILGGLAILGALSMLFSRHPMRSAVSLLFVMFVLAVMYALLSAPFMAALQLIIYAGAIMTLIIFVVSLVDVKGDDLNKVFSRLALIAVPTVLALLVLWILYMVGIKFESHDMGKDFGTAKQFSEVLLSVYFLPFALSSLLLLVGIIGISALRGKKE